MKCGKPTDGKAHCPMCLKVLRVKQKQRYAELTDEQRKKMYLKNLRYLAENPNKKALYASRRAEYQRKYMLGDELMAKWIILIVIVLLIIGVAITQIAFEEGWADGYANGVAKGIEMRKEERNGEKREKESA